MQMHLQEPLLDLAPQWEILPGYRLEARLGVGGYGEVWSVVDANGAKKAVKVFHGQADDDRSARELRGLHRALELDHPGVLKIERIESVRGHVVALMDLADGTLRERFEHHRALGEVGIPRDELLMYLSEAADALDYLFEVALLAHLDVKPENLLLVNGHVRVGDFGLIKHLEDSNHSHIGGMTPRYTAPEVFEGRPSRHSDQYSLATVYQEMLTGRPPFAGTSMAALASQHLSATPQLDGLEPLERFAVGKALSKSPEHRFADCRRFVERLMHRSAATLVTTSPAATTVPPLGLESRSAADDRDGAHDGQTIVVTMPKVVSLPRMDVPDRPTLRRPSVVIGVGGLGGSVLRKLRQRLTDHVGAAEHIPAIQLLYIDTDPDALHQAVQGSGDAVLCEAEMAFAPLRSSQHYRDSVISSLESISRRWFYNVPRSLRTSGLRALGRLALLDNWPAIRKAIANAVGTAVDPKSLERTAEHTKWSMVESDPRVFVVTSLTGGTGGGMLVDLGYAIRQVLAETGLADDDVCTLMAYSYSRSVTNGIPQANALACLRELRHFGQPGCDYPGEHACGMAGFREAGPTYASTYLFADDDDVQSGREELADRMALYLYLSTATASASLLDNCRRQKHREQYTDGVSLRTVGLCLFADTSSDDPKPYAEALCRHVARKWKVGLTAAQQDERVVFGNVEQTNASAHVLDTGVATSVEQEFHARGLGAAEMLMHVDRAIDECVGEDRASYWSKVLEESADQVATGSGCSLIDKERMLRRLDAFLGVIEDPSAVESVLCRPIGHFASTLSSAASERGARLGKEMAEWIVSLLNRKEFRVYGALQAALALTERLQAELQGLREALSIAQQEETASHETFANQGPASGWLRKSGKHAQRAAGMVYAEKRCMVLRHQAAINGLSAIEAQAVSAADAIREYWKTLTQFANRFRSLPPYLSRGTTEHEDDGEARIAACYARQLGELIERLDCHCEMYLLPPSTPFSKMFAGGEGLDALADDLLAAARRVILNACRETDNDFLARVACGDSQQQLDAMVRNSLDGASADLLRCGGAKRLLLVAPRASYTDRLCHAIESASQDEVTLCSEDFASVTVCYECEDISWDGIESWLVRQRHDCEEMAARLHTRIDINWETRSESSAARSF